MTDEDKNMYNVIGKAILILYLLLMAKWIFFSDHIQPDLSSPDDYPYEQYCGPGGQGC